MIAVEPSDAMRAELRAQLPDLQGLRLVLADADGIEGSGGVRSPRDVVLD